jgi:alpha-beta hydrolase superfamily lysophospholipase
MDELLEKDCKNFKCLINHSGEKALLKCWLPIDGNKPHASVLIFHDLGENISSFEAGIIELRSKGFKVYAINMKVPYPGKDSTKKEFPKSFRHFTLELLQVIAYIKYLEAGTPPFLLTQGLGALVGLINTRKHPNFVRGLICCSPMFQLTEKVIPLRRFLIKTLSDFTPQLHIPNGISPKFTSNRKVKIGDDFGKYEPKLTARESYEYLKAMSQARKNFNKISVPILFICPDQSSVHKYNFLRKAISKHKYEDKIHFINLHTKYHAIASDRAAAIETYSKYILPWMHKTIEENIPASEDTLEQPSHEIPNHSESKNEVPLLSGESEPT